MNTRDENRYDTSMRRDVAYGKISRDELISKWAWEYESKMLEGKSYDWSYVDDERSGKMLEDFYRAALRLAEQGIKFDGLSRSLLEQIEQHIQDVAYYQAEQRFEKEFG